MPGGDDPDATGVGADRFGYEREVGVERLGDVVRERAQERLADDPSRPGGDGAQQVALPGGVAGVGDGRFEEGGQDVDGGRRRREPRW
jgi:hypothetical protein